MPEKNGYNFDSIHFYYKSFYLTPNQTVVEDDFGGSVDVSPADPGGGHCKYSDKHTDISSSQHCLLLRNIHINGTVGEIFDDPPFVELRVQFTTVPYKILADQ